MSLTHTITLPLMVGRTYQISGSDSVSGANASDTVTVTSDGNNTVTLDLTASLSNYIVTSISLTYETDTLSDSVTSLTPTLTYTITPYYSNGTAWTAITSGATATYSLSKNDDDYFALDTYGESTGVIVAGSATNYSSQASATVTVTLSYGSYELTGNTATATVYRTATTDSVTSVEVSDISLSATTLYPKVTATVTVKTSSNTTGTEID